MKKIVVPLCTIMVLIVLPSVLSARDLVIGLSPFQEPSAAKAQAKAVLQFLTDTVQPGELALLVDAYHITSLGVFAVPNKPFYANPKAKVGANRQVVATLLAFAKAAHLPNGGSDPVVRGAIRLPSFLRFIGENHPASIESDVIVLGHPLYDDPKQPEFSMVERIPGDGHFSHTRRDTPFGTKGQEVLLIHRRLHWALPDESWQKDGHHGFYVERFWRVYLAQQGGRLATFSHDLSTVLSRAARGATPLSQDDVLEPTTKLEMIRLGRPPVVKQKTSIYDRKLSQDSLPLAQLQKAQHVEIGITWAQPQVDLDLHARPRSDAPVLSYRQTQSRDGTYYKDFTSSPRVTNGYETIAFNVPLKMQELLIAVNYFGGRTDEPVTGELRLSLNDRTYAHPFVITATEGNDGRGGEATIESGKAANTQWLIIDPLPILGVDRHAMALFPHKAHK